VTGLTEDEILWDLPLSRGMAYLHAALAREGVEMRWESAEQDEVMQKAIALMKSRRPVDR
jgi:hypothetical protein